MQRKPRKQNADEGKEGKGRVECELKSVKGFEYVIIVIITILLCVCVCFSSLDVVPIRDLWSN